MLLFVAALAASMLASGAWCAADVLPGRVREWRRTDGRVRPIALVLASVVGVGTALRFFLVPPHHAMYFDEPWYAEAACNLARAGRLVLCEETWTGRACSPYAKALGWPILIAPWDALFGCATRAGIDINRALGSATVLLVALATRCAGAGWWHGVIAAAVLAIHPVHVAWSATGETNVAAAAMLLAGLAGALMYLRTARPCGAALAVSGLALSTAIRPEVLLPAVASAVVLALVGRASLRQRLCVSSALAIVCAGAAASGLRLWEMNESISGGAFLASRNIGENLLGISRGEAMPVHAVVLAAGLAGFGMSIVRSGRRGSAWLLLAASVSGALVALAYDRFDGRMLLGATVGLLPLGGLAFDWSPPRASGRRLIETIAATVFVAALVPLWARALWAASAPPETQLLETRIASRAAGLSLSADSLFVTEQPTVLAAVGLQHVMSTERALGDTEQLRRLVAGGRPVYFLRDMFCEPGFRGVGAPPRCAEILERVALSPVVEEKLHGRAYTLYRVQASQR